MLTEKRFSEPEELPLPLVTVADKIAEREVIIPGAVAQISGELLEELNDGWRVTVGPYEAADIPAFVKRRAS